MQNYTRTTIERAIAQGRRVRIIYQSGDDLSERTIKPKYIDEDKVSAYCYLRHAKRVFKFDGILTAQLIEEN